MESGTETAPLRERAFSGVRASSGRDLSRSLISSINSMGVIPQTASGENVLMRSATAPTSLPSMYTGLPLMPPATLVTLALPNILATMMSWFGPFWFLSRPTISIGTASGSIPWKTVHAIPFMPGLTSFRCIISTGPAMGREGGASAANKGRPTAANIKRIAADRMFIGGKLQLYLIVQRGAGAFACQWDWPPGRSHGGCSLLHLDKS